MPVRLFLTELRFEKFQIPTKQPEKQNFFTSTFEFRYFLPFFGHLVSNRSQAYKSVKLAFFEPVRLFHPCTLIKI